jgi:hypothetical protein
MTRLNVNDARREALFASGLQRSDAPDAETVADVISRTVRQFGSRGCAGQLPISVRTVRHRLDRIRNKAGCPRWPT